MRIFDITIAHKKHGNLAGFIVKADNHSQARWKAWKFFRDTLNADRETPFRKTELRFMTTLANFHNDTLCVSINEACYGPLI